MPRKRTKDLDLPTRCYRSKVGAVEYHPIGGGSITIAGKNATAAQILAAYETHIKEVNPTTLQYFADRYYETNNFQILAERTKTDYRECQKIPCEAFEGFNCHYMTPAHITRYIRKRAKKSKRRANMELTWFKNIFTNACAENLFSGENPTTDIKPIRLSRAERKANKAKKRYVADEDYQAMYEIVPDVGKVAMEIAYCTGIRPGDVLSLRREHIKEWLDIEENKTGQQYEKEITPRLGKALRLSLTIPGQPFAGWIVRNRWGNQYTRSGWSANWKKWKAKLPMVQQFTFQEIRMKAITDAEKNTKQEFSMHQDARMLRIYDWEKPRSPSHE